MEGAYQNSSFSRKQDGQESPGANSSANQQHVKHGSGGKTRTSRGSNQSEHKLHITNIPCNMTMNELTNILIKFAKPKQVFIQKSKQISSTWAIVEFDTYRDAETAMRGCHDKPPFNLCVKFAKKSGGSEPNKTSAISPRSLKNSFGNSSSLELTQQSISPFDEKKVSCLMTSTPTQPDNLCHTFVPASPVNKVPIGWCKVCRKKTGGVCGACKKASYCSQNCATADFKRHVTECYIPVPAIFFPLEASTNSSSESSVPSFSNVENERCSFTSPPKKLSAKNSKVSFNGDNSFSETSDDFSFKEKEEGLEKRNKRESHTRRAGTNGQSNDNAQFRKFADGGKRKEAGQQSHFSPPLLNNKVVQHDNANKMSNNDRSPTTKNKMWLPVDELEIGVAYEVEVTSRNNYGLSVVKVANRQLMCKLNDDLKSAWSNLAPFNSDKDFFGVVKHNGTIYRCKILQNQDGNDTKLRVVCVDFGNILLVNTNDMKQLPKNFDSPAKAIQVKFNEGYSDMYMSYEVGQVLHVKAVDKNKGKSWVVEIVSNSKTIQLSSSTSENTDNSWSEKVTSPRIHPHNILMTSPRSPKGNSCSRGDNNLEIQRCMEIQLLEPPPLNTCAEVLITEVRSEKVFWAHFSSKLEELDTIESMLNPSIDYKPSTYNPIVNEYVAVYHELSWFRAKVLKITQTVRLGLIDYGQIIESSPDKIASLPEDVRKIPRQAMKFIVVGKLLVRLGVDLKLPVQLVSSEADSAGCHAVKIAFPIKSVNHTIQKEKNELSPKVANLKQTSVSENIGAVEKLPHNQFSKVIITHVVETTYWVTLFNNLELMDTIMKKLIHHCSQDSVAIVPTVGELVAANFESEWCRAKVLTVDPKLQVFFIDYGNESEVTSSQVRRLPRDLTEIPAQAIKITFDTSSPEKYFNVSDTTEIIVSVKPVPGAEKSSGDCITVTIENEAKQKETTATTQVPVLEDKPKTFKSLDVLLFDTVLKFIVTLQGNPGYVCLSENWPILNKLMLDLNGEELSVQNDPSFLEVGKALAFSLDGVWHRATVLSLNPLEIFLVDYGNKIVEPALKKFAVLPSSFLDCPAQAIKVTYDRGTPDWHNNEDEIEFAAKVVNKLPDGANVLHLQDKEVLPCANAEEEQTQQSQALEQVDLPQLQPETDAIGATGATKSVNSSSTSNELSCSQAVVLARQCKNEVLVSCVEGDQIWVTLKSNQEELDMLMDNLNKGKDSFEPFIPKMGDYVTVFFEPLKLWHRAKVLSELSDMYEVLFIDYGGTDKVSMEHLKTLPPEFARLPAQAIQIQICEDSQIDAKTLNMEDTIHIKLITVVKGGLSIVI